eukprot:TRINITY_DN69936_c0_g1_i1.p1 TRINITY_DN69936_c0_g1~~TRINITY_DN69936_c0_g1_i1.p1  ORF type:complete len:445 (+),score=78.00 TRINITY_DN69936_c0_g1_i1:143-1477(+)
MYDRDSGLKQSPAVRCASSPSSPVLPRSLSASHDHIHSEGTTPMSIRDARGRDRDRLDRHDTDVPPALGHSASSDVPSPSGVTSPESVSSTIVATPAPSAAPVLSPTLSFTIAAVLTVLSSVQVLLITFTRRTIQYTSSSVVLTFEVVKLVGTIVLFYLSSREFLLPKVLTKASFHRGKWYALPAFFYALCNNSIFVTLRLFDAYTAQAWLSTRILFTGLLFQWIFQRNLVGRQWLVLGVQTIFVVLQSWGRVGALKFATLLLPMQALMTSSAAVMNEFLLKTNPNVDVNESNFWMYVWGVLFNLLGGLAVNNWEFRPLLPSEINGWLIATVVNGALVGYTTSLVFKYLNVFARNFANAMSVGLTAVLSFGLMGTSLSLMDVMHVTIITECIMLWYSKMTLSELAQWLKENWIITAGHGVVAGLFLAQHLDPTLRSTIFKSIGL